MPYASTADLPKSVKDVLPKHAQDIFKEAYNSAWEQYKDASHRQGNASHEETSMRVAWSAVKKSYEKGADDKWYRK